MVCKITFCFKFPDIPDKAGRKTKRRRRTMRFMQTQKTFLKSSLITKLNFGIKQYFFPNKRKNLSPFRTDFPIKFYALCTLGGRVARNREIMKPMRTQVSNKLNCT